MRFIEKYVTDLTPNTAIARNNLNNINLPEHNKAILRLEVELRDKNAPKYRRNIGAGKRGNGGRNNFRTLPERQIVQPAIAPAAGALAVVPMEKVST